MTKTSGCFIASATIVCCLMSAPAWGDAAFVAGVYSRVVYRISLDETQEPQRVGQFAEIHGEIVEIACRPGSGGIFAFSARDASVGILDLETGVSSVVQCPKVSSFGGGVQFSPDGKYVYAEAIMKEEEDQESEESEWRAAGVVIDVEDVGNPIIVSSEVPPRKNVAFSGDGSSLLYWDTGGIWTYHLESQTAGILCEVEGAGREGLSCAGIVADGDEVAFFTRPSGADHIVINRVTGRTYEVLATASSGYPCHLNPVGGPYWLYDVPEREVHVVQLPSGAEAQFRASVEDHLPVRVAKEPGEEGGSGFELDGRELINLAYSYIYLSPDQEYSVFVRSDDFRYPSYVVVRNNQSGVFGKPHRFDRVGLLTNVVFLED